jgi:hypothetical protein
VLRIGGPIAEAPVLGPAEIQELTGVTPDRYRDLAVLRGDTSDNLPGVHGIGAKTAAKLLNAIGSLDAALADLADGGPRVLEAIGRSYTAKLAAPEAAAAIERNRAIMAMREDLPLDLDLTGPTGRGRLPLPDPTAVLEGAELGPLSRRWASALCGIPAEGHAPVPPPATPAATLTEPPTHSAARVVVPTPRRAPTAERVAPAVTDEVPVTDTVTPPEPELPGRTPQLVAAGPRVPARPAHWPLTM